MQSWLLSQVWNIKTPNLSIFSTEKILSILNHKMVQRKGLDFIALHLRNQGQHKCLPHLHSLTKLYIQIFVFHIVTVLLGVGLFPNLIIIRRCDISTQILVKFSYCEKSTHFLKKHCIVLMFQTSDNSKLLRRVLWITAELTIVSSLRHKNTQPIYIFNRENPQNSEPQNGPRRGLDFIALYSEAVAIFSCYNSDLWK